VGLAEKEVHTTILDQHCAKLQPGMEKNLCGGDSGEYVAADGKVRRQRRPPSSLSKACYKTLMKIIGHWLLFKYVEGQFTPLSKPFKTKAAAEKARLKLPERERRSVAVGVIRIKR
jgi:hypothetical protein